MSEAKHTPGPWCVTATGDAFRVEGHTHTEVRTEDEHGNPCEWSSYSIANAHLIAAAPDLLEALMFISDDMYGHTDDYKKIARAAIAKATGSTTCD